LKNQLDIELINRLGQNDARALEELFDRYYVRMCRFALPLLRDYDTCEELASDVFMSLWRSRETLQLRGTSVKAYLFKSIKNKIFNHLETQRSKSHWLQFEEDHIIDFVDEVEDTVPADLLDQIEEAIKQLPPQCALIFRMNKIEELRYKEIASILSISEKTVENQIGKALKLIRTSLTKPKVDLP